MRKSAKIRSGFSLVEMLLVITVIAVLLALTVPAITGLIRGYSLSQDSDVLMGRLKQARQQAIAENRAIHVRFYSFSDQLSGGDKAIRAIQLWKRRDDGILQAVTEIQRLADSVIITENSQFTKLGPEVNASADEKPPPLPSGHTFRTFQFRPDGSTDLDLSSQWYFTMILAPDTDELPSNFATIQIEPLTGAVGLHRP